MACVQSCRDMATLLGEHVLDVELMIGSVKG